MSRVGIVLPFSMGEVDLDDADDQGVRPACYEADCSRPDVTKMKPCNEEADLENGLTFRRRLDIWRD